VRKANIFLSTCKYLTRFVIITELNQRCANEVSAARYNLKNLQAISSLLVTRIGVSLGLDSKSLLKLDHETELIQFYPIFP
jgi:hypothetical protein